MRTAARARLQVVNGGRSKSDPVGPYERPCWFPADDAGDCIEPGCDAPKRAEDPGGLFVCADPAHRLSHGTRVPPIGYTGPAWQQPPDPAKASAAAKSAPKLTPATVAAAMTEEAALLAEIGRRIASGKPPSATDRARMKLATDRLAAAARVLDGRI